MICSTKRLVWGFAIFAAAGMFAAANRAATAATATYFGADASILPSFPNSQAANNAFFANLATLGTDTLDSYVPASGPDPTNHPNLSFGATGITASEAFAGVQASGSIGLDITPLNTLLAVPALASDSMQLSSPVTAFGSYFLNAGDDPNIPDTLSLLLGNSVTHTSQTLTIGTFGPGASNFNGAYFGVTTSTPFDTVTLLQSNPGDGVLLDNITVGTAVPEPSSLLLLIAGAAGLGLLIRRR
jgi:PEP-CTERM motif-containing protein